ncbi:MAG TPA: TetR/AcrR family transcriptional regulator [Nitrolancea sp.]|jgi:AcrR family transcriptional regulator|nr:TetR/AcrR family transcriptional regulator [Nitrolancea sp.]
MAPTTRDQTPRSVVDHNAIKHSSLTHNRSPTRKGQLRRQQILDAAAYCFESMGYRTASMAAIAERAETTKANVYHYFKSKHDLLFALHSGWIDDLFESFQHATEELDADPTLMIRQVFRDVLSLIDARPNQMRSYFEYFRELPADLQAEARAKRTAYQNAVEAYITQGIEEGRFTAQSSRVATFGMFGMCQWAYQWYRPGGDHLGPEAIADQLFDIFINGLSSDK